MFKTTFFALVFLNNRINLANEFSELVTYRVVITAGWTGRPNDPLVRMHFKNCFVTKQSPNIQVYPCTGETSDFFFGGGGGGLMIRRIHSNTQITIKQSPMATLLYMRLQVLNMLTVTQHTSQLDKSIPHMSQQILASCHHSILNSFFNFLCWLL